MPKIAAENFCQIALYVGSSGYPIQMQLIVPLG